MSLVSGSLTAATSGRAKLRLGLEPKENPGSKKGLVGSTEGVEEAEVVPTRTADMSP